MFKDIIKIVSISFCFSISLSCKSTENKALEIKFSKDSSTILISNIEPSSLLQLKNNLATDTSYQKLVAVLETPAENDSVSMEREWPGRLALIDDDIVFIPDSPFLKGKVYLVETVLGMKFASAVDVIRSEVGRVSKKQQIVLSR